MKTKILFMLATCFLLCNYTLSQSNNDPCKTWDAVIIGIEKVDTAFVVTGMNLMPDCSSTGIYFEQWANKECVKELKIGYKVDFVKFKPKNGYWIYKGMYIESDKDKNLKKK